MICGIEVLRREPAGCGSTGIQPYSTAGVELIVGRDREQALLLVAGCRSCGFGSLAVVSGEAGIGKTTLVRDLLLQARKRGVFAISGGCYDLTTTPPFGPWVEAFHSYQPTNDEPALPTWLGDPDRFQDGGGQAELFEEARSFFSSIAEVQPLVDCSRGLALVGSGQSGLVALPLTPHSPVRHLDRDHLSR